MLSRYRCECKYSFAGHNCAETTSLHPLDSKCRLASGAKSEEGATATKKDYEDFQAALKFFGVSLISGVNFELFCTRPVDCESQTFSAFFSYGKNIWGK